MSYFTYSKTYEDKESEISVSSLLESLPPAVENWDNEYSGTYDPMEHVEKKIIVRCLIRASKAEKRKFKQNERLRILKLLECEVPFLNDFKQLTVKDDSIWEQISHLCQLTIHDRHNSYEAMQQKFKKMKISSS